MPSLKEIKYSNNQQETIFQARAKGFIYREPLAEIFALDRQYQELIPILWDRFGLSRRIELARLSTPYISRYIQPILMLPANKTPEAAACFLLLYLLFAPGLSFFKNWSAWQHLLLRWTTGTIAGVPDQHDFELLPIKNDDPGRGAIRLEDLKLFFNRWQIPLPPALFDLDQKPGTINEKTSGSERTEKDEKFIRELRVGIESDDQISIQEPGRTAQCYTANSIGFRSSRDKSWKEFLGAIREGSFSVGSSGRFARPQERSMAYQDGLSVRFSEAKSNRRKEYDARKKMLDRISDKFLRFLKKEFSCSLPDGLKIYRPAKTESGTDIYQFKFQAKDGSTDLMDRRDSDYSDFKKMTDEEILKEIARLSDQLEISKQQGISPSEEEVERLQNLCENALKREISRDIIEKLVK